jgi:hypothetical protein
MVGPSQPGKGDHRQGNQSDHAHPTPPFSDLHGRVTPQSWGRPREQQDEGAIPTSRWVRPLYDQGEGHDHGEPRPAWGPGLGDHLILDLYEITMVQAYLDAGMTASASFELFVRRVPKTRNFLVAAGLDQALAFLENFRLSPDKLADLSRVHALPPATLRALGELRFAGDVDAIPEGTVVFADEPLIRVTAALPQAQIVETRSPDQRAATDATAGTDDRIDGCRRAAAGPRHARGQAGRSRATSRRAPRAGGARDGPVAARLALPLAGAAVLTQDLSHPHSGSRRIHSPAQLNAGQPGFTPVRSACRSTERCR